MLTTAGLGIALSRKAQVEGYRRAHYLVLVVDVGGNAAEGHEKSLGQSRLHCLARNTLRKRSMKRRFMGSGLISEGGGMPEVPVESRRLRLSFTICGVGSSWHNNIYRRGRWSPVDQ